MRRLSLFILVLCSFFVNGCVKYVNIPVAICPKPPTIIEESLKTDTLKGNAKTPDILRAFAWDITYLKQLKEQYRVLLQGYDEPQLKLNILPLAK